MKSGKLKLLEPSGPHLACEGTAIPLIMYKTSVLASQNKPIRAFWGINPSFLSGNCKQNVNKLCGRNAEILLAKTLVIRIANAV